MKRIVFGCLVAMLLCACTPVVEPAVETSEVTMQTEVVTPAATEPVATTEAETRPVQETVPATTTPSDTKETVATEPTQPPTEKRGENETPDW